MTNTDDTDDVRQTILYGELHELRVALEASLARLNALIAEMDERDRAWQGWNLPSGLEGPLPMLLFPKGWSEKLRRRPKPDNFYVKLAGYVKLCQQHHIAYGPRIAADNDVNENTVRTWVAEGRRRHPELFEEVAG